MDVSNLLKVSELRKIIKNRFTVKKLQAQGLERDLTQIYKPLAESQTKNTTDLLTHLSNLSNENNKKLIDFKDTFKNFPELLASIDQVKSLLDIKTTEIMNKLKRKDPGVAADISELDHETREFEDALSEITSEADTGIDTLSTDQSAGKRKKSLPGVRKARDYVEKEATARELLKHEEEASQTTYQHALNASRDKTADNLKAYFNDPEHVNNLIRFVEHNPDINFSSNPWRRIKTELPQLYREIKTAKTSKKGSGLIKFLPGNKTDLVRELFRLMGSYKSGNKNVYNELNAVVDQLRRKGVLSIDQSKKIYRTLL